MKADLRISVKDYHPPSLRAASWQAGESGGRPSGRAPTHSKGSARFRRGGESREASGVRAYPAAFTLHFIFGPILSYIAPMLFKSSADLFNSSADLFKSR